MSDQAVLREYLIALGFKVNNLAQTKFQMGVDKMDKRVGMLGKTIIGVTAAATTMTTVFAREMEKMYYLSRRVKSSVGNIQALEFAGGQIGVGAERMRGALEGMARSIRSNPGLVGLLNQLGVQVQGRDMSDVLTDFVTQLKKMPSYKAQAYAGLFGIDPDTLFMLEDGLDKMKEADALRKRMAAEANVDLDAAAKAGRDFSNSMKEVWERVGLIGTRISMEVLSSLQKMANFLNSNLDSMNRWLGQHKTIGGALASPFKEENSRRTGGPRTWFDWIFTHRVDPKKPGEGPTFIGDSSAGMSKEALMSSLESQYALPAGLLARMYKKESANGTQLVSPKGALGPFQFMPSTAGQYGVTDPYDFNQSATGAARYLSDLYKKYGDWQQATAAYNWGPGNLDRYGLGRAPAETRDYVSSVAPQVTQTNHFHIDGVGNPQEVADRVASQQRNVNIDLVRNFTPRTQ